MKSSMDPTSRKILKTATTYVDNSKIEKFCVVFNKVNAF